MKTLIVVLFAVAMIFYGCSTTQQAESNADQPEIISMTSLPPVAPNFPTNGLRLKILFHISGSGSVMDVKLLSSSGDPDWDHTAIDSMKQWRFAATNIDSLSSGRWIRNTIVLQVQEPLVLTLGELTVDNQSMADSLYSLLQNGSNFDAISKQVLPGGSAPIGRFIGAVDIARYPKHVRDELRKLVLNDCTHPLRIGSKFTIFKRYKPDGIFDIP